MSAENGLRPDVTPEAVVALRLAADNMPISRPGQQWSGAADWLRRRADAFEVALRDTPQATCWCELTTEVLRKAAALMRDNGADAAAGDWYSGFLTAVADWLDDTANANERANQVFAPWLAGRDALNRNALAVARAYLGEDA